MRTLEKEAKTVDEAIWTGLQELNLTRDKVRIEILDQGSRGLFGLGSRPAKVLLIEIVEEEKIDLNIRGFLRGDDEIDSAKRTESAADSRPEPTKPASERPQRESRPAQPRRETAPAAERRGPTQTDSSDDAAAPASTYHDLPPQNETSRRIAEQLQRQPQSTLPQRSVEHLKQPSRDQQRRPQRDHRSSSGPRRDGRAPAPNRTASVLPPADLIVPTEGAEAHLYQFLSELIQAMKLDCSIGVELKEGILQASIYGDGNDLGLLIGKHGATLDALQYLCSLAVNRNKSERYRVQIQIGDYRQRRENTLNQLAQRVAAKVIREGRAQSLEPMLASERRLIHLSLQDHPQVQTSSDGEEPNRYVVISPRNDAPATDEAES